jgi:hypothetical protein
MSPGPASVCYFVVISGGRRLPIADLLCRNCLPNGAKSTNAARSAQFSGLPCRPVHRWPDDVARDRKRMGLECDLARVRLRQSVRGGRDGTDAGSARLSQIIQKNSESLLTGGSAPDYIPTTTRAARRWRPSRSLLFNLKESRVSDTLKGREPKANEPATMRFALSDL